MSFLLSMLNGLPRFTRFLICNLFFMLFFVVVSVNLLNVSELECFSSGIFSVLTNFRYDFSWQLLRELPSPNDSINSFSSLMTTITTFPECFTDSVRDFTLHLISRPYCQSLIWDIHPSCEGLTFPANLTHVFSLYSEAHSAALASQQELTRLALLHDLVEIGSEGEIGDYGTTYYRNLFPYGIDSYWASHSLIQQEISLLNSVHALESPLPITTSSFTNLTSSVLSAVLPSPNYFALLFAAVFFSAIFGVLFNGLGSLVS